MFIEKTRDKGIGYENHTGRPGTSSKVNCFAYDLNVIGSLV